MKILLSIIGLISILYVGSLAIPPETKNKAMATVGLEGFSPTRFVIQSTLNARDSISNKINPKDSPGKEEKSLDRLERSLREIKYAQERYVTSPSTELKDQIEKEIRETEGILEELKNESNSKKEGAVSSVFRATADAIRKITGTESDSCKIPSES